MIQTIWSLAYFYRTIEVYGYHYEYQVCNLDKSDIHFEDKLKSLMDNGFWLGTQADNIYGYFKYYGEMK